MNINYKQPQFELFPANSATLEDVDKPKFLLAKLTLSVESLVIFSIYKPKAHTSNAIFSLISISNNEAIKKDLHCRF